MSHRPVLARLAGDAAALGAGAALPLAFAPWSLGLLAPLGLAVLFVQWLGAPARAAAWRGWLFGLGLFGVGASWVRESFRFSDVPGPAAVALTALLVVYLALFPAAAGYLQARCCAGHGRAARALLVLPAAWVLAEWVRGWLLSGFPWLLLGYSQTDTWLGGIAPVLGVYGVSGAVALTAALLAAAVLVPWPARAALAVGAVALWGVAGLAGRVEWTSPEGPPRPVAVVQGNVPQHLKWRDEERAATLERYLGLTRAHWDADLVVWPETAVPAFAHRARDFLADLAVEAEAHGATVLLGIPYADLGSGRYYNSVLALGRGEPALYHKRHLVPFGEFVPLSSVLGRVLDLLNAPMSDFSSGPRDQPPLLADGVRVGVSICYEDAFGEEVILALPAATLLVNVSNDGWFGDSIAPHQHLEIARLRARETGRDLVRATNTGISALMDHRGQVRGRSPQFEPHVLRGEVQPRTGTTPYARLGNLPVVAGAIALLALAAGLGRRG